MKKFKINFKGRIKNFNLPENKSFQMKSSFLLYSRKFLRFANCFVI